MIWDVAKAQQRFNLAHARLGGAQVKLQAFLEQQLDAKGAVKSYGTSSNPSQQLKNKLGQATTIPGGMLTLSLESRAVHDRAVTTLVDDWGPNIGWAKAVACVGIIHPADAGWKLATIVEWSHSRFPEAVRERLFPDVVVVAATGSPASGVAEAVKANVAAYDFEVDERHDDPNDTRHREAEFLKGWKAALDPARQPYSAATLKKLTWNNLGFRLGRLFGCASDEMIGIVYDWAVRQQKATRADYRERRASNTTG